MTINTITYFALSNNMHLNTPVFSSKKKDFFLDNYTSRSRIRVIYFLRSL